MELAVITAGRILNILLQISALRVLAITLDKENVGNYYLYTTGMLFAISVIVNPANSFFDREVLRKNSNGIKSLKEQYRRYIIIGGVLCLSITLGLLAGKEIIESIEINALILAYYLVSVGVSRNTATLNMFRKRIECILLTLLNSILSLLCAYLLTRLIDVNFKFWILGLIIGSMPVLMLSNFSQRKIQTAGIDENKSEIRTFVLPLILASLIFWIQSQGYKIITAFGFNVEALAEISITIAIIAGVYGAAESIINQHKLPILNGKAAIDKGNILTHWRGYATKNTGIMTWIGVAIFLYGEWLVKVISTYTGQQMKIMVLSVAVSEYFRVLSGIKAQYIYLSAGTRDLQKPAIYSCLSAVAGIMIAIYLQRIECVALTLAAANFINYNRMPKIDGFKCWEMYKEVKIINLAIYLMINIVLLRALRDTDQYILIAAIFSALYLMIENRENFKFN